MIKLPVKVRFEQAVYGSFRFWQRGYAVLSQSAGCRPEWLTEMRTACQRCGEPPYGAVAAESLFALRLKSGPWMVVGAFPQGCDDQGRPGAMAFHALFVSPWAYQWVVANPFAFTGAMRGDWSRTDQNRNLSVGHLDLGKINETYSSISDDDPRLAPIVGALTQSRRVIVQSLEPIDDLARTVWLALPRHIRRRATVATWAFDNANEFDLVAMPKLAGVSLSASDLIFAFEHAGR